MSLTASEVWSRLLDRARTQLSDHIVDTWLSPLTAAEYSGESLTLTAPDQFSVEWNERRHSAILESLAPVAVGHPVKIELRVHADRLQRSQMDLFVPVKGQERSVIEPERPRENVTLSALNDRYTFDTFVVGKSNDLAAAAAAAVSQAPGKTYNPLFFYGPTGLGKTHLMQAIAHDIIKRAPQTRVTYITTEQFTNDVITSIGKGAMHDFRRRYRETDLFLVDDVHFIGGKNSTQEEFFHTFNALYDLKKQIILTSDRSPKEITTLEERLRSRFEWGLITDIQPPNLETRMAILKRKVESNNIYITDDVIAYIAENITDNIRRLEGALIRLLAFASLTGREISLEMASEVLSSFFQGNSSGPVKIADVMKVVSDATDVTADQLKSKRRTQDLARARQMAMYLSREMTGASLNQIGRAFGGRDHSTVAHACQKIGKDMSDDPRFRGYVLDLQDKVRGRRT